MLLSAVSVLVVAQSSSEIAEGLITLYIRSNGSETVTVMWTCKESSRKQIATEDRTVKTRANTKEGKSQRKTDAWSKMEND